MTRESVRRAIRTFAAAFLALFIPGLLGWLNALTEWAEGQGSTPFPDASGLAYLGVSAIVAGVVALVQFGWNAVEDASGHGFLRDVPSRVGPGEGGATNTRVLAVLALVVVVMALIAVLL